MKSCKTKSDNMKWNIFDPHKNDKTKLPDEKGVYLICARKNTDLPDLMRGLSYYNMNGNKVTYVGMSQRGLKSRDYHDHFERNNAGRSTLRKSFGVLFGYKKIPRNKNCKPSQYKFNPTQEKKLTIWMKKNLLLYYKIVSNPSSYEEDIIKEYNPPLNINKNRNIINSKFRRKLKDLRRNCLKKNLK